MKMKMARKYHIRTIVCFLFSSLSLYATDINRDSLIRELKATPEKSELRARILQQLSESYREDAPDESIFYGEELLHLANTLDAPELLYLGHMSTGVAYAIKGSAPEIALQHFIDALDIAKSKTGKDWELRQVKSRINICGVHWQLENMGPAMDYAYQNVAQLRAMDEPLTLADAYRTVALLHRSSKQYDSTFFYLNEAIDIYEKLEDYHRKASTLITLSTAYQQTGLYEQALQILHQVQEHARIHQDSTMIRDTYTGLAQAYLQLNRLDSAEYYARSLLAIARQKGLLPELSESYKVLSGLFSSINQADSALYYYRLYAESREQLISDEKARVIQEMDSKYQARESARENRQLREQYALVNFRNTLLLISSLLFLFLVAVIAFFYRRERKRKAELEKLNEEAANSHSWLLTLMSEKKHMVNLIAHDIRNPLSLIQFNTHALGQAETLDEKERKQILAEIEQATADIDRASLKIMEIENKTESRIHLQNVSFDLIRVLKESIGEFSPFARSKSISLQFKTDQGHSFITGDPFLFRHIIANLLSNAIKYSPPHKAVELSFFLNEKIAAFSVKDQGPGLSQQDQQQLFQRGKVFQPSTTESSRGEGLYLTRRYVEAMGGKITVESSPGQGALFTVSFPIESLKTGE